jgi:hypothetical protein
MPVEYKILILLLIHGIGDFIFQSRMMANNKSTNVFWLLTHVFVYSFVWFTIGLFFYPVLIVLKFVAITFICHFTTDFFTSKLTTKLHSENKIHWFFCVIYGDQMLHFIQLILTYKFLI